jgi:hypothetical protein
MNSRNNSVRSTCRSRFGTGLDGHVDGWQPLECLNFCRVRFPKFQRPRNTGFVSSSGESVEMGFVSG